jgi:hypothetical protein
MPQVVHRGKSGPLCPFLIDGVSGLRKNQAVPANSCIVQRSTLSLKGRPGVPGWTVKGLRKVCERETESSPGILQSDRQLFGPEKVGSCGVSPVVPTTGYGSEPLQGGFVRVDHGHTDMEHGGSEPFAAARVRSTFSEASLSGSFSQPRPTVWVASPSQAAALSAPLTVVGRRGRSHAVRGVTRHQTGACVLAEVVLSREICPVWRSAQFRVSTPSRLSRMFATTVRAARSAGVSSAFNGPRGFVASSLAKAPSWLKASRLISYTAVSSSIGLGCGTLARMRAKMWVS